MADQAAIRRLFYDQQQMVQALPGTAAENWTVDDLVSFERWFFDHLEPATRAACGEARLEASIASVSAAFRRASRSARRSVFFTLVVDPATFSPDPGWTMPVAGQQVAPTGRVYIVTVTVQGLDGSTARQDAHVSVDADGVASLFVTPKAC